MATKIQAIAVCPFKPKIPRRVAYAVAKMPTTTTDGCLVGLIAITKTEEIGTPRIKPKGFEAATVEEKIKP